MFDSQERVIFTPKKGINIYKRKDGRWEARYLKSINKDGKRLYGSVYGKSFDEAKHKQDEAIQNYSRSKNNTVRVVFELQEISAEWRESIKRSVKESTYIKYDSIIRKHILCNIYAVCIEAIIQLQPRLSLIPIHAERGGITARSVALEVR